MSLPRFELGEDLDIVDLSGCFGLRGRVLISNILDADAVIRLSECLSNEECWAASFASQEYGRRLLGLGRTRDSSITAAVEAAYRDHGAPYSHVFRAFPLSRYHKEQSEIARLLQALCELFYSAPFAALVRKVTGFATLRVRAPVATRYEVGHFYATHTDSTGGMSHVASFVLNVSKRWEAQWGGLLQFVGAEGHVDEAYLPVFNSLSLFLASCSHGVSMVAPIAGGPRLSIAGQLVV
jgi:SM-20-related protein